MSLKKQLARIVHKLERKIDTVRRRPDDADPIVDAYGGFTMDKTVVLRGRVLAAARQLTQRADQSRWANAKDFIGLFLTDEIADVSVVAPDFGVQTKTDEEGFFVLILEDAKALGASAISVQIGSDDRRFDLPVFSTGEHTFGVISDIDDTVMRTGAFSLIRNLWTSVTDNMFGRHVFPDAVELLQNLQKQGVCFFYVSSSPWNLHHYLMDVFTRNNLPLGPFFLRDLGVSETQFITGTHGDHKTSAIEEILQANPHLNFTLIGDTGQHDPHIYADIVSRYPDRITQVILRMAQAEALSQDLRRDLDRIKESPAQLYVGDNYHALLDDMQSTPA